MAVVRLPANWLMLSMKLLVHLMNSRKNLQLPVSTVLAVGWAWLIVKDGKLEISSTPNQDNPLMDVAEVKGTPVSRS